MPKEAPIVQELPTDSAEPGKADPFSGYVQVKPRELTAEPIPSQEASGASVPRKPFNYVTDKRHFPRRKLGRDVEAERRAAAEALRNHVLLMQPKGHA